MGDSRAAANSPQGCGGGRHFPALLGASGRGSVRSGILSRRAPHHGSAWRCWEARGGAPGRPCVQRAHKYGHGWGGEGTAAFRRQTAAQRRCVSLQRRLLTGATPAQGKGVSRRAGQRHSPALMSAGACARGVLTRL